MSASTSSPEYALPELVMGQLKKKRSFRNLHTNAPAFLRQSFTINGISLAGWDGYFCVSFWLGHTTRKTVQTVF